MSDLKYTQTRHRMLAEVEAGNIASFAHTSWEWGDRMSHMHRSEARTVGDLHRADLVTIVASHMDPSSWRAVDATNAGRALLAAWDTKHGKVKV